MRTGEPYRFESHNFQIVKRIPWLICRNCGLVRLHNPITDWCVKLGCNADDHPKFKTMLKHLTE